MPSLFNSSRYMLIAVAALFFAAGVGWFLAKHTLNSNPVDTVPDIQKISAVVKTEVHLYFGDLQGHYLRAEQRVLERPSDDAAFGRQLMDALILGPQKPGGQTLPEGARVRAFFITGGTAYVDFVAEAFSKHPGGVEMELLTIYSIVNTLVVNVEAIREVKILIGGQEQLTLAGHIDLQHSFIADMMWIR